MSTDDDLRAALDALGPRGVAAKRNPLSEQQLPAIPGPTVMLYAEQLARYRRDYEALINFAADVCGVPRERLCALDLEKYRLDHELPVGDVLSAYLLRVGGR